MNDNTIIILAAAFILLSFGAVSYGTEEEDNMKPHAVNVLIEGADVCFWYQSRRRLKKIKCEH